MNETEVKKKYKRKQKRKTEKKSKNQETNDQVVDQDDEEMSLEQYMGDKSNWLFEVQTKNFKEKIVDVKFIPHYSNQ